MGPYLRGRAGKNKALWRGGGRKSVFEFIEGELEAM